MTFTRHALLLLALFAVGATALAAPRPQLTPEVLERTFAVLEAAREVQAVQHIEDLLLKETLGNLTAEEVNDQLQMLLVQSPDPTSARLAFKHLVERDSLRVHQIGELITSAFLQKEAAALQVMRGALMGANNELHSNIGGGMRRFRRIGPVYRSILSTEFASWGTPEGHARLRELMVNHDAPGLIDTLRFVLRHGDLDDFEAAFSLRIQATEELEQLEAFLKQRRRDFKDLKKAHKKTKPKYGNGASRAFTVNFTEAMISETELRIGLLEQMCGTSYKIMTGYAKSRKLPRIPGKKDGLARLERWLKRAQARLDEQAAEALEQKQ